MSSRSRTTGAARAGVLAPLLLAGALASCGDETPELAPALTPAALTESREVHAPATPPTPPPPPVAPMVEPALPVRDAGRPAEEEPSLDPSERARREHEARYPLEGVATHFLARVYTRPNASSTVLGYLRRGATFRASARVPGVGCARGWYEIAGEGFVCRGEGYQIGEGPQSFSPAPRAPALEQALPYAYGWVRADAAPLYYRLPSATERAEVEAALASQDARRDAEERAEAARAAREEAERARAEARAAAALRAAEHEESDADEGNEEPEADDGVEAPPPPGSVGDGSDELPEIPEIPGEVPMPDVVRMQLRRGYFVSVDGEEQSESGERFYRTVRGAYVPSGAVMPNEPPTHRGVVLGGRWQLPIAFVYRSGAQKLRPVRGRRFRNAGSYARHTPIIVSDTIERGRRSWVVARDGFAINRRAVRVAERRDRPAGVGADERWIHISLGEQTLVAYEGDEPVFATSVSTGREGFETPRGLFRVESKHVSTTLDNLQNEAESYLIEDVPWTMYFEGNYALHAAFWHNGFGRVRSHGCVNMAPADARWVFEWAGPELPESWHGVFARGGRRGTTIYITD